MTADHEARDLMATNAGPWAHDDGTPCPTYWADRPTSRNGDPWWCTTHQQHVHVANHEAQRQAADSQAADQGAQDAELHKVLELTVGPDVDDFLETLALAGYTVVKTRYEYAGSLMHEGRTDTRIRRIVGPWVPVPEGSAE